MKILIVEDQAIIIKTLSNIITEIYPRAIIKNASDILTAKTLMKQFDFDLVITDLDFNGEKRFAAAELAFEYNIKCIVYSAHYNRAFIKRAQEFKVAAFVSKLGVLEDLEYALKNYKTLDNYVCSFCTKQNKPEETNEITFPELTYIEETILDRLLTQTPRKEIAKELKITAQSLNTYINRMTAKNDCNLLVLTHRYIIWKRSKK